MCQHTPEWFMMRKFCITATGAYELWRDGTINSQQFRDVRKLFNIYEPMLSQKQSKPMILKI